MMKKLLLLATLFCLLAAPAWADVALDATSGTGANSNSTSHTHTPVGTPSLVVVGAAFREGGGAPQTPTSITYGGENLSLIPGCSRQGTNTMVELWALANPPAGAQTVAVTGAVGTDQMTTMVETFTGTSGAFRTCITNEGTTGQNADADSIGSAVGEYGIAVISVQATMDCAADAASPVSVEQREQDLAANMTGCLYTEVGAAGTINMRVDLSAVPNNWAIAAVSIQASSTSSTRRRGFQ